MAKPVRYSALCFVVPMGRIKDLGSVVLLASVLVAVVCVCVWQAVKMVESESLPSRRWKRLLPPRRLI